MSEQDSKLKYFFVFFLNPAAFSLPDANLSVTDLLLTLSERPLSLSSSEDCHSQPQTGGGDNIPAFDTTTTLIGRSDIRNLFRANRTPAFYYWYQHRNQTSTATRSGILPPFPSTFLTDSSNLTRLAFLLRFKNICWSTTCICGLVKCQTLVETVFLLVSEQWRYAFTLWSCKLLLTNHG